MAGSIYMAGATPVKYIGKCEPCNRPVSSKVGNITYPNKQDIITCPDCGNKCTGELMYGVVNRMVCDDRCMGAYGPKCVCGCGGVNHGGIWIEVLDNVPAQFIEDYRKDQERRQRVAEKKREKKEAERNKEFVIWGADHFDDLVTIEAYTGDNYFICGAKEKIARREILSDNYLAAVLRVIAEETARIEKENAAKRSTYQGNEGEVIKRTLTISAIIHLEDHYAVHYKNQPVPTKPMYKFTDEAGNVYVWYASKYQANTRKDGTWSTSDVWKTGDVYTVTAKVKKHEEYKGTKQTIIYYIKVV